MRKPSVKNGNRFSPSHAARHLQLVAAEIDHIAFDEDADAEQAHEP
jgi:hypothetical protein